MVNLCNGLSEDKANQVHIISLFNISSNMFLHKQVNSAVTLHTLNKKMGFDVTIFLKLYKLITTLQPTVVHTHLRAFNYNYLNILFNRSVSYFHTLHSDALLECPSSKNRALRRVFYKKSVTPITISQQSALSFKHTYGLQVDHLIPNGTTPVDKSSKFAEVENEVNSYKTNKDTKVFLHVANLLPVKQHTVLIDAFKACISESINAVLVLIGDRRPGDDTIFKTIKENEGKHIKYLGVKHNVGDYLLNSDIFILVSKIEGMPISLIEAFSAKCVPLVTPVGGMLNMVTHNVNGLLTSDVTSKFITQGIQSVMALNNDELNQISKNAYQTFINKYTMQQCIAKHAKLYHNN